MSHRLRCLPFHARYLKSTEELMYIEPSARDNSGRVHLSDFQKADSMLKMSVRETVDVSSFSHIRIGVF